MTEYHSMTIMNMELRLLIKVYQDIPLQANIEPEWFSGLSLGLNFNGFARVYKAECQCSDNPCSHKDQAKVADGVFGFIPHMGFK